MPNMIRLYRKIRFATLLLLLGTSVFAGQDSIKIPRTHQDYLIVTGESAQIQGERNRWDALFNTNQFVYGREPAPFLKEVVDKIPVGKVLDIAMGEGRNAVFLAKKGFKVEGVDISEVALRKARRLARENHVPIRTINADLNQYRIVPESYDAIININYLQHSLISGIKKGLRSGGIIVFESWTIDQMTNPGGKSFPKEYLLKKGELRKLFEDFEILIYREFNDGKDALASMVARKPIKN